MSRTHILYGLLALLVLLLAVLGYFYMSLRETHTNALMEHSEQEATLEARISELESTLKAITDKNLALGSTLVEEQGKNKSFENQIQTIQKTVGDLAKIQSTDPELLKKYSKVYFLSENYIPENIAVVPAEYVYTSDKTLRSHANVLPYLTRMLEAARRDDVDIRVVSGYRSFGEQASLKSNYLVSYGSGANRFSADQGYSEHQLGSTFDLTTSALGASYTSFGATEAFTWLTENAHRYGFVLSYPKGNTHYQYEPWHWRFVGTKLAEDLYKSGKSLYDLDQRAIDAYLLYLFD